MLNRYDRSFADIANDRRLALSYRYRPCLYRTAFQLDTLFYSVLDATHTISHGHDERSVTAFEPEIRYDPRRLACVALIL